MMMSIRRLSVTLLATATACTDAPPPSIDVAGVPVPQAAYEALAEPERQSLVDLVTLGAVIADGTVDSLIAPMVDRSTDSALVARLPAALGARATGLDEAALRAAYQQSPEWELEVRHMIRLAEPTSPEDERAAARQVAEDVARRAADGEDFARLAAEFSEEPGAADRGGRLEPGRRGTWVDPFWNAAVALTPGQTTGVVESPYGFHVIKLESRRAIPFEEADRAAVLERIVPPATAADAMAAWASSTGAVLLDPPAVGAARSALLAGQPPADAVIVASGAGGEYAGGELVAGWAALPTRERMALEDSDEAAFARWVETEARTGLWADAALQLGVTAPEAARSAAAASWSTTVALWAQIFGFAPDMAATAVYEAARLATLSGAPEVRAQRAQLRSLRPLLRRLYPLALPEP